jgi:hypothetical protein
VGVVSGRFPPLALEGVDTAVEPHVRAASEQIYERIMETVQDYLRDNVEFNIGQKIATAEREAAYARGRLVEVEAQRDALYFAAIGLRPILEAAESNASGTEKWTDTSARIHSVRAALARASKPTS